MVSVLKASESHWLNVCLIDTRPKGWEICSIYIDYYCSFHDVEENRQLLRYLNWMYALELAVRFQDEWRYGKVFPLLQIMLFSRVFQSVRDECWVVRVAPSNTFLAYKAELGYTWVQSFSCSCLSLCFIWRKEILLSASMARADGAWVADRETQCRSAWCWGQPMEKGRCCWAGIEGSSGTEPVLGLYFWGSVLLLQSNSCVTMLW